MPSNPNPTKNPVSDAPVGDLFDSMFPASPLPDSLPVAPSKGAIIATGKTTHRTLDPWTEPLRLGITDPRSDLAGDSAAWIKVLGLAFREDGNDQHGIYGLLHCCRCEGAQLDRRRDRFYLVRGEIDVATWGEVYRPKLEGLGEAVRKVLTEAWR